MIPVTSCPICGHSQFYPFLTCTDYTVSGKQFELIICQQCRLVITSPRPATDELGNYYQSADYISHTSKANSLTNSIYLLARTFTMRGKRNLVKILQPKTGSLLDYGCGTGDFLEACKKDGWNITGVEPGESARSLALQKGIPVVEKLSEVANSFNLITLWHVLEHVPDLNETLQELHRKLETDGTLLIAVPNHGSFDGVKYKAYWAGFDVPRHLWHFNQKNMEQLLLNNGFKLKQVKPMILDSFYVSLLSETYLGKGIMRFVSAFVTGMLSNLKARKTREFSSLIYIASK